MRGKKGEKHRDPTAPPRRRANHQPGQGTYENDRPPVIGPVGRATGPVRLRVVKHTASKTLKQHRAQVTSPQATANTDEWQGYNQLERQRLTVNQGEHEGARDDDGDGGRAVHINTTEGLWTGIRNFLRPFRGVHTDPLSGYIALGEHNVNLKRITPKFLAALVRCK